MCLSDGVLHVNLASNVSLGMGTSGADGRDAVIIVALLLSVCFLPSGWPETDSDSDSDSDREMLAGELAFYLRF